VSSQCPQNRGLVLERELFEAALVEHEREIRSHRVLRLGGVLFDVQQPWSSEAQQIGARHVTW
jgi:hypothetical protein